MRACPWRRRSHSSELLSSRQTTVQQGNLPGEARDESLNSLRCKCDFGNQTYHTAARRPVHVRLHGGTVPSCRYL